MIAGRKPSISSHFAFGAPAIRTRHVVAWHLFHTDAEWQAAKENRLVSDVEKLTREALMAGGYPVTKAMQMMVSFTSEEHIQRKTGGDHRAYFQQMKTHDVTQIAKDFRRKR
jgi:hypothetical protein